MKINVTTIGHICLDHNRVEHSVYESGGGPALFINTVLSKTDDCTIKIIADYGPDLLPFLQDVDIHPTEPNLEKTLNYHNICHPGETRQQYAYNRDFDFCSFDIEELKPILHNTNILFYSPLLATIRPQYLIKQLEELPETCLKILLPQGYFRDFDHSDKVVHREIANIPDYFNHFDFVIMSDEDYPDILNKVSQLTSEYKFNIIITRGSKDAAYFHNGLVSYISTVPCENIIDSTGSGDVFSAVFGYFYFKTKNVNLSIENAHKIAGYSLAYNTDQMRSAEFNPFKAVHLKE